MFIIIIIVVIIIIMRRNVGNIFNLCALNSVYNPLYCQDLLLDLIQTRKVTKQLCNSDFKISLY